MMKISYVLPLLLTAGLYAAPAANALTLDNGRNLNGLSFNGLSFNGQNLNGLSFNGTARGSANAGHATAVILKDGVHVPLK
jgi:hypothetical protein